jgi:hypothetical protein
MIEINVSGGLGVRLFQYAFGYILSTLKNDSLKILESDNYKQNYESATKRKYSKFEKLTQIFPNIKLQIQNKNNFQTNPKIISGHTHNIEELIKYNGKIIMKGSGFQNYNFYKNHKKLIKNLLYIPEEKL